MWTYAQRLFRLADMDPTCGERRDVVVKSFTIEIELESLCFRPQPDSKPGNRGDFREGFRTGLKQEMATASLHDRPSGALPNALTG
jgi:hypothetical protein